MTDIPIQYVTKETLAGFKQEHQNLKSVQIPDLARRIDDARQMGDLSENAEYQSAREEMAWAMTRVKELEAIMDHAVLINEGQKSDGNIRVGSEVVVTLNGKEKTYTIVGAHDADPLAGRISNESPLGSALLGQKVGDSVEVAIPAGNATYTVISVK